MDLVLQMGDDPVTNWPIQEPFPRLDENGAKMFKGTKLPSCDKEGLASINDGMICV